MVRDLVDAAMNMVRGGREDDVYPEAEKRAEERLLDLLLPAQPAATAPPPPPAAPANEKDAGKPLFLVSAQGQVTTQEAPEDTKAAERRERTREKLRKLLQEGKLEERDVELEVTQESFPPMDAMQAPEGMQGPDINIMDMPREILPKRKMGGVDWTAAEGARRSQLKQPQAGGGDAAGFGMVSYHRRRLKMKLNLKTLFDFGVTSKGLSGTKTKKGPGRMATHVSQAGGYQAHPPILREDLTC